MKATELAQVCLQSVSTGLAVMRSWEHRENEKVYELADTLVCTGLDELRALIDASVPGNDSEDEE
jgi:hypothetical protein